jgi:hypothetical protein
MNQLISWLVGLFVPRLMETQGRDIKGPFSTRMSSKSSRHDFEKPNLTIKGPFSKRILSHTRHDFENCESEFFKEEVLMSNDTLLKRAKKISSSKLL